MACEEILQYPYFRDIPYITTPSIRFEKAVIRSELYTPIINIIWIVGLYEISLLWTVFGFSLDLAI